LTYDKSIFWLYSWLHRIPEATHTLTRSLFDKSSGKRLGRKAWMHESEKLEEARHFLERMRQATEPKGFQYELSAFLTAARSALQYACKEAKSEAKKKTGGQSWYDNAVSSAPLVQFFKKERDLNVHETPVVPSTSVTIGLPALAISGGMGRVEPVSSPDHAPRCDTPAGDPAPIVPPWQPPVVTYEYSFKDWTGPEDAISLCEQYLAEVQAIVSDGEVRGHLTK
jgi:hypothetical protein